MTLSSASTSFHGILDNSPGSSSMNEDKDCITLQNMAMDTQPDHDRSDEITIMKLKKTAYGQRKYNNKQHCIYCSKPFCKMARHLAQVHKSELDVAKALSFPKGSKERRIHLDLLRNKGNRAHNNEVTKAGRGEMVLRQQTTLKHVKVKDYEHCVNCLGLFRRKPMWKHMQRCNLAKRCKVTNPGRTRALALRAYAQPVPEGVSKKNMEIDQ